MASFIDFAFQEEYQRMKRLGDKLAEIDSLIDWEAFRPIVKDIYNNKSEQGGRPNIDEVVMIKILVLQEWHGLSDPELERQITDRISALDSQGTRDCIAIAIRQDSKKYMKMLKKHRKSRQLRHEYS